MQMTGVNTSLRFPSAGCSKCESEGEKSVRTAAKASNDEFKLYKPSRISRLRRRLCLRSLVIEIKSAKALYD